MKNIKIIIPTIVALGTCLLLNASPMLSIPAGPVFDFIATGCSGTKSNHPLNSFTSHASQTGQPFDEIVHPFKSGEVNKNELYEESVGPNRISSPLATMIVGATFSNPIDLGTVGNDSLWYFSPIFNTSTGAYGDETGYESDDIIFKISFTEPSLLAVSTCGSDFDTFLSLRNSLRNVVFQNDDDGPKCKGRQFRNASFQMGLLNTQQAGNGMTETMVAPGTYYIVVEGYAHYTGRGRLFVRALPERFVQFTRREAAAEDTNLTGITVAFHPDGSSLRISIPQETAPFYLYDGLGKMVKQGTLASTESNVDVRELNSGIYILSVIAGNKTEHRKIEIIK